MSISDRQTTLRHREKNLAGMVFWAAATLLLTSGGVLGGVLLWLRSLPVGTGVGEGGYVILGRFAVGMAAAETLFGCSVLAALVAWFCGDRRAKWLFLGQTALFVMAQAFG